MNTYQHEVAAKVNDNCSNIEWVVFDPQMYVAKYTVGRHSSWDYFPDESSTQEISDINWWGERCLEIDNAAELAGANAICSPAPLPTSFDSGFYSFSRDVFFRQKESTSKKVFATVILNEPQLGSPDYVAESASVFSEPGIDSVYLIVQNERGPRQPIQTSASVFGLMKFIYLLRAANVEVGVGFCDFDALLCSAAGANFVATGKHFNLRRFTAERWDDEESEGRNVSFWCEPSLLCYLNAADIAELRNQGHLESATSTSPFSQEILSNIDSGTPWLGLSWRHYMWCFDKLAKEVADNPGLLRAMLREAYTKWEPIRNDIQSDDLILSHHAGDGEWLVEWRKGVRDFVKYIDENSS